MTDRLILFSAPMVRALLEGRKTQTRRIIKPPKWADASTEMEPDDDGTLLAICRETGCLAAVATRFATGDRLWVKETWRDEHPIAIQEGRYSQPGRAGIPGPPGVSYRTIYRADGEPLQAWRRSDGKHPYFTLDGPSDEAAARHPTVCSTFNRADGRGAFWDSARYMPRWASRLTLTVTDVRVQRLQEISEADAEAEGAERLVMDDEGRFYQSESGTYRCGFAGVWSHINGADSWDASPWIVALTFTVERRNIDAGASA